MTKKKTVNHFIRIYINKIENIITFKNKTGYYLILGYYYIINS